MPLHQEGCAPPSRGRFAPSPTGELHLGNARTALLAWLWARSERGAFVLRVEDLDLPRTKPGLAQRQLEELAWLGLDWDEGPDAGGPYAPYLQSQRTTLYEETVQSLLARDLAYECFCSRAEIAAASAPQLPGDELRYPGTCATLTAAERDERRRTRTPAIRLRVPPGPVAFDDEIQGPQSFDPHAQVGDFVLKRSDGVFAYQLAVVVDDAAMQIGQVLRGADLLSSTSRQIVLYRALGLPPPRWAHAPLALGPGGVRLSKRDRSMSLFALRMDGANPRHVVAALAKSCDLRWDGTDGDCTPGRLLPMFEVRRVPRAPTILG